MTPESARAYLQTVYGGKLYAGAHAPTEGKAEIRELRSLLLGLPWSSTPDDPAGVGSLTDVACQGLNDGAWAVEEDGGSIPRGQGCLPLVFLSENETDPEWVSRWRDLLIREVLPVGLRIFGYLHPKEGHQTQILGASNVLGAVGGTQAGVLQGMKSVILAAYLAYPRNEILSGKKDSTDLIRDVLASFNVLLFPGPWRANPEGRTQVSYLAHVADPVEVLAREARKGKIVREIPLPDGGKHKVTLQVPGVPPEGATIRSAVSALVRAQKGATGWLPGPDGGW